MNASWLRRWPAAAGILAAAGCASAGGGRGDAGALAYGVPAVPSAVYAYSDTTQMDMQMATVDLGSRGTVEVAFDAAAAGVKATAHWTDFEGRLASPQGTVSADESGITGQFVLSVDGRGRIEVVEAPQLSEAFRQVAGSGGSMAHALFIRLPGRAVPPGAVWVDTVRIEETGDGLTSAYQAVVTSTWAGDTTVAGRALRVIRTSSAVSLNVQGVAQGLEIRQALTGTSRGVALWDPERRLLVSREESGTLNGTMELPAIGAQAIPMRAQTRTRLALQDG